VADKTIYWCNAPVAEIAKEIEDHFTEYRKWQTETGYADRIITSYNTFYALNDDGTLRVTRNEDNIATINVPHMKSLTRRLHILVTENKLAFQPRAENSDSQSQVEADLARGIATYYADEKGMHNTLSDAVLGALICLEYFVHCPWDLTEGYELTADGEQTIKSGDQKFELYDPFNVAKSTSQAKSPWYIIRQKVNKYDEAALCPEFADDIIASNCTPDMYLDGQRSLQSGGRLKGINPDQDMTYKYIMYHARTPAMPDGRYTEVIAGQVTANRFLKYTAVPVFRISAGEVLTTVWGDSPTVDLLPLQQALNAIFSTTLTNVLNNNNQLIWSGDPNLVTRKMGDGQTLVSSSSPPQGINLTNSGSEGYKMIDMLVNHQQLLSGVNDVARGHPTDSVTTAGGQALMIAQAIQYVSDLQKSYAALAGDVATQLIENIKQFATEDLTAYIVGTSRKGEIKTFKSQDLMRVKRITVDLGNPMVQSFAGRNELVQAWQQQGILKDPKQIINFLRTGELDQVTENEFSDQLLIREENESIRKGIKPTAILTDNHAEHIVGMKGIMASQEARDNPEVLQVWLAHAQEHIDLMRSVPPDLAAVLSGQPLPQPLPPGPGPAAPGAPQIDGAHLPAMPQGAPPQTAGAYKQAVSAMPPQPKGPQQ
jgi:hypothetical protein